MRPDAPPVHVAFALVALTLLLTAPTVLADESLPSPLPEASSLAPVVISATREEEPAFTTGRSIESVTEQQLDERQPRTAPEALRETTGVFVQQTNWGGGSPIVRGLVGPQVLLLVDGVRLNNAVYRTGPLQYLNLLDPFELQRLEVLRGPGSVAYGSDALGGVIQAVMQVPADRRGQGFGWNADGGGRYGSAARQRAAHAALDVGVEGLGARVSASFKDFEDLNGGRGIGVQPFTSYRQLNTAARVDYRPSGAALHDWRFTAAGYLARMFDVGRGEGLLPKHRGTRYQIADDLVYARAHARFASLATDATLTVHYQHFDEDKTDLSYDDANVVLQKEARDLTTVHSVGVDAVFTTRLFGDHLSLGYGGEFKRDWIDSSKASRPADGEWETAALPPYPEGARYDLGGAWLLATGELLPLDWQGRLGLTGGYRLQHMGGHAGARGDAPAFDHSHLAHVFQAGIEAGYGERWKGALTWSQGFRAPNAQESLLIGDAGDWYNAPNKGLGPERADTFELLSRFDAWRLYGSAAGYVTLISDVIKRVPTTWQGQTETDGNLVVENANGGNARLFGAEALLGARLGLGLTLEGAVTWTKGDESLDDAARAADAEGRSTVPLSKIPPLFGRGGLRWSGAIAAGTTAFAESYLLWATKQDRLSDLDKTDVRIPEGGTPGWVTWNARGGVAFDERVRVTLTLENLTDTAYKYHVSGFSMPGTSALLALDVSI